MWIWANVGIWFTAQIKTCLQIESVRKRSIHANTTTIKAGSYLHISPIFCSSTFNGEIFVLLFSLSPFISALNLYITPFSRSFFNLVINAHDCSVKQDLFSFISKTISLCQEHNHYLSVRSKSLYNGLQFLNVCPWRAWQVDMAGCFWAIKLIHANWSDIRTYC